MRTLFRKAGFKTYVVDEFRTSGRCSKCEIGICKNTMVMENPRPYRNGSVLVHGLISCKNGCCYWKRDTNGATNIYQEEITLQSFYKNSQNQNLHVLKYAKKSLNYFLVYNKSYNKYDEIKYLTQSELSEGCTQIMPNYTNKKLINHFNV